MVRLAMAPPILHLNRHVPHRTLHGHLWVYATEVARLEGVAMPGDLVEVRDPGGNSIGWGFYSPSSKIVVRLLTRRARAIDPAFFKERLQQAIGHRERILPGRPARRLVNSEGDLLPGLTVDQYGDVLVVQTTTTGMDRLLPMWTELLLETCRPRTIIERNDVPVRSFEGLPARTGVLHGPPVQALRLRIGSLDFPCDPNDAHKTGVYLDQQSSWEVVAGMVRPGMRVLDAFCHLGGFGLHALAAGATEAVLLDSSAASLGGARQAAEWAGSAARIRCVEDNAFGYLKGADGANERFDLIVLDPPTFTRTRAAVPQALRGYKEIHLRALKMLAPGGILATFSCSHHITSEAFLDMVADAAGDAHRTLRRERMLGASPDHPVLVAVPESEYLKGAVFSVLDG
jgi:23S rRNA (cytosine1962-C5)-methyltransferase